MNNEVIEYLIKNSVKPELFEKGEKDFWNDPHIAKSMLKAHFNQNHNLASYKEDKIQRIVDFCYSKLNLKNEDSILDCGCGPGLYCERFYQKGLRVTGIDISLNSIEYALKSAQRKELKINYLCQNYLDMKFSNTFDAAFIIWQDFCVLDYDERSTFLKNIHKSLKPNSYFVLDISTPRIDDNNTESSNWNAYNTGFFSEEPHLVLENLYFYNEKRIRLKQYVVIEEQRKRVFRIYHQHYTLKSIQELLNDHGFKVKHYYKNLYGEKFKKQNTTMGIIAQRS